MPKWDLADIYKGMMPFMVLQWIAVLILYFFPQIILVLPEHDLRHEVGSIQTTEGGEDHGTQKIPDAGAGLAAGAAAAPAVALAQGQRNPLEAAEREPRGHAAHDAAQQASPPTSTRCRTGA